MIANVSGATITNDGAWNGDMNNHRHADHDRHDYRRDRDRPRQQFGRHGQRAGDDRRKRQQQRNVYADRPARGRRTSTFANTSSGTLTVGAFQFGTTANPFGALDNGGAVTVASGGQINVGAISQTGGSIGNSGTVTVTGAITETGGTIDNSGTVAVTARIAVNGGKLINEAGSGGVTTSALSIAAGGEVDNSAKITSTAARSPTREPMSATRAANSPRR